MTDKEAIEILKKIRLGIKIDTQAPNVKLRNIATMKVQALEIILNRLKELEQIEEAHHKLNGELRKELQLKNKMIDEMIEVIANVTVPQEKCKQCIKEYFTKKASEENG